jgi:hypothetical protein
MLIMQIQLTNYLEIISTGNQFLLFGQSGPQLLYYSTNGTSWNRSSLNLGWPTNQKQAWGAGNGVFLMTYYNSTFARSTDGNSWTTIPGGWFPKNINYNEALDVWYAWENNGDRIISRDNGQTFQLDAVYGSPGNEYNTAYEWSKREPENKRITFGTNNNASDLPQFRYFVDAPVFQSGYPVEGATSNVETAKMYVEFDSNGIVSDLKGVPMDPPYTTTDTNPSLNLTFPSTFPSGETPDEELPEGTVLTVGIASENVVNRSPASGFEEAIVQPVPDGPDAPLAGLTTIWSGNESSRKIVTGIDLQSSGGMVWIKNATGGNPHNLFDTVRGPLKSLASNDGAAELDAAGTLSSFDSDGFSIGLNSYVNGPTFDYVGWSFGITPKFFDVQTWTGTGSGSGQIIPHDLTSEPACVIGKRTNGTAGWYVYHKDIGFANRLLLNSTNAVSSGGVVTAVSNTELTVYGELENSTDTYVGYLFADEPGVIKCGSYTGSGSSQLIDCGFDAQWVLLKSSSSTAGNWMYLRCKAW